MDADFCLFDPSKEVRVTQSMMHDGSDYSLFEGRTFKGWPVMTISSGELTMVNGEVNARAGRGKPVRCESSGDKKERRNQTESVPTSAGSPK